MDDGEHAAGGGCSGLARSGDDKTRRQQGARRKAARRRGGRAGGRAGGRVQRLPAVVCGVDGPAWRAAADAPRGSREMRCGAWLAAALAMCGVRGASAGQEEEEQELLRALEDGHDVFQAFKVIGSAEWEVHNQTLVPLSVDDVMELIESDGSRAPAVAEKYQGVVLFVSRAVSLMMPNNDYRRLLCATSRTVVIAAENFYGATVGT